MLFTCHPGLYNWMQLLNSKEKAKKRVKEHHLDAVSKAKLAQQFLQFKLKIQEFEHQNESTINKIRSDYHKKKQQLMVNSNQQSTVSESKSSIQNDIRNNEERSMKHLKVRKSARGYHNSGQIQQRQKEDDARSLIEKLNDEFRLMTEHSSGQSQFISQQFQKRLSSTKPKPVEIRLPNPNRRVDHQIDYLCTEQSEEIQYLEPPSYSSGQQSSDFERENQNLRKMVQVLENKCSLAQNRNQELSNYIKNNARKRSSIDMKSVVRNLKSTLEEFYYNMSEEYLADKFFSIQRVVKKVERKLNRVDSVVNSIKEEKEKLRSPRRRSNLFQKKSLSVNSDISISLEARTKSQTIHQHQKLTDNYEDIFRLKGEIQMLKVKCINLQNYVGQLEGIRHAFKQQNFNMIRKIDILTSEKVKLNEENERKLQNQRKLSSDKINQLEKLLQKDQQKIQNLQKQKVKQSKDFNKCQQELKVKISDLLNQNEDLKIKLQTSQRESKRKNSTIKQLEGNLKGLNDKLLEKDKQLYSISSKIRTLENELQIKDNKIEGLESMMFREQAKLNQSFNKIGDNSVSKVNIFLQESSQMLDGERSIPLSPFDKTKGQNRWGDQGLFNMFDNKIATKMSDNEKNTLIVKNMELEEKMSLSNSEIWKMQNLIKKLEDENKKMTFEKNELNRQLELVEIKFMTMREQLLKLKEMNNNKVDSSSINQKIHNFSRNSKPLMSDRPAVSQRSINFSYLKSLNYSDISQGDGKREIKQKHQTFDKNAGQMILKEERDKLDHEQGINYLLEQLKNKNEELISCVRENQELRRQNQHLRSELKQLGQQRQKLLEDLPLLDNLNYCKLSNIQPLKQDLHKQSTSFKLSFENSAFFHQELEESFQSNISQVFKQDQILQAKMKHGKASRKEQLRLFQKTTEYIQSLKEIITEKDNKIKELEKENEFIKRQPRSKTVSLTKQFQSQQIDSSLKEKNSSYCSEPQDLLKDELDGDCRSLQLRNRISPTTHEIKRVEAEKQFLFEQNKILQKQIDVLRQELFRSQQQENSLIKIKDLLKQQLRKQMNIHEGQMQKMQIQIQKLHLSLQQSDQPPNFQSIRHLFIKIIQIHRMMQQGSIRVSRRQQKRRQFQEYVRSVCNLLKLNETVCNRLAGKTV